MPCPVCNQNIGEADHRMCVLNMLKSGEIKSVAEWEKLAKKPETIIIRKVIRKVRKSE